MKCKESMRNEVIDDMLVDAGLWDAPQVRATLGTLASLAALKAPRAGGELAAMLAGSTAPPPVTTAGLATPPVAPALAQTEHPAQASESAQPHEAVHPSPPEHSDDLARRRWLRKNRSVVVGAAVLTAMGLGVSGVAAATAGLPGGHENILQRLISHWEPAWAPAPPAIRQPMPAPDSPDVATVPSSGAVPWNAPAQTGPAAHEPGARDSHGAQQNGGQGTGFQPTQAPAGQGGQDASAGTPGKGGKVSGQGTADGTAATGSATKTASTTTATALKTAAPLVLLKTVDAVSNVEASLPSWLASLTNR